jgi:hypothetical protein
MLRQVLFQHKKWVVAGLEAHARQRDVHGFILGAVEENAGKQTHFPQRKPFESSPHVALGVRSSLITPQLGVAKSHDLDFDF